MIDNAQEKILTSAVSKVEVKAFEEALQALCEAHNVFFYHEDSQGSALLRRPAEDEKPGHEMQISEWGHA